MELRGEDVSAGHRAGKGQSVAGRCGFQPGLGRFHVIAVHEIEAAAVGNAVPQRVRTYLHYFVPAHVRHLEADGDSACRRKAAYPPGQEGKPRGIAFLAVLEQHLQADADAEEGFAGGGGDHGLAQVAGGQLGHAVGHRALTRHDHALGGGDNCRIAGDDDLLAGRNMLDGLRHRAQIAHAVINDRDDAHRTLRGCLWSMARHWHADRVRSPCAGRDRAP